MYIYCLPMLRPWDETDSQLLNIVSSQRRHKIMSYLSRTDQKLSLYAALLVRLGLSNATGIPANKLVFGIDTRHKPFSLSAPNYYFNLSHTQDFVLCGITDDETIGVDVEKIKTGSDKIMKQLFHLEELQYVENASVDEQSLRFYEIWTRKEAYTKKIGTGLHRNLSTLNTLSKTKSSFLHTWRYGNYICSACGKPNTSVIIKNISESEVRNYFTGRYIPSSL